MSISSSPPRPLTPAVRSRLWREPAVRFWWMSAVVLALIGVYLAASQLYTWNQERRLIANGISIQAIVRVANGVPIAGNLQPPQSAVELAYTHDGVEYEVKGYLAGRKDAIQVGAPVELRLDPNNPRTWTARLEPTPLLRQLIGASLTIPAIAIVLLLSAWKHRQMQRVYENGQIVATNVMALRSSPIAPRSQAAVCTPSDENDKRLFTVYIPHSLIGLAVGDDVNLLIHRDKALAVMRYA